MLVHCLSCRSLLPFQGALVQALQLITLLICHSISIAGHHGWQLSTSWDALPIEALVQHLSNLLRTPLHNLLHKHPAQGALSAAVGCKNRRGSKELICQG